MKETPNVFQLLLTPRTLENKTYCWHCIFSLYAPLLTEDVKKNARNRRLSDLLQGLYGVVDRVQYRRQASVTSSMDSGAVRPDPPAVHCGRQYGS
jgi:hypothetical protein